MPTLWLPPKVVVPGQPVEQHRRCFAQRREALQDHLLVRAQHALRVDHALGQLGRARGEEELRDGVRGRPCRARHRPLRSAASRAATRTRRVGRPSIVPSTSTTGVSARTTVAIAFGVRRAAREHQARRQQADDVAQLAVVLRDPANTPATRMSTARRPSTRRGLSSRCSTSFVGQDHDRPLRRQAEVEQGLRDRTGAAQRFGRRSRRASRRRARAWRRACARARRRPSAAADR